MDAALSGLASIASPTTFGIVILGTVLGTLVGALPGIGPTTMIALLLPFVIGMDPTVAIVFCGVIYCAANYGGSITAILVNTPGEASAAMTTIDGYQLAQKGQAGKALGMSVVASTVGGIFSIVVMILAAPALADLAYNFGPPEYFALALCGLSMLATMGDAPPAKNYIAGILGLLLATVGVEITTGIPRFTFGQPELIGGLQFVPMMIGLFAGSELLAQAARAHEPRQLIPETAAAIPTWAEFRSCFRVIGMASVLGTFIGTLPAAGSTVAGLVTYNEGRRWARRPQEYGKGSLEGVAAPEAGNNAATGGAMVPTLALGIPGSGTTAIILGAMIMLGIRPGPTLFQQQPEFLWALFSGMLLANFVFLAIGLWFVKLFARISLVPAALLWPAVFVFCVIGAYSVGNSIFDVGVMLVFSILGLVLRERGYAPAPIVMGLVLGTLVEESLKQSVIIFEGEWWLFVTRPIALFFLAVAILTAFFVTFRRQSTNASAGAPESSPGS